MQSEVVPVMDGYEKRGEFPKELVRKAGAAGLYGAVFPPSVGGTDMGYLAATVIQEEMARHDVRLASCNNQQGSTCPSCIYFGVTPAHMLDLSNALRTNVLSLDDFVVPVENRLGAEGGGFAKLCADKAMQIFGGHGLAREYRVSWLKSYADLFFTGEASANVQKLLSPRTPWATRSRPVTTASRACAISARTTWPPI